MIVFQNPNDIKNSREEIGEATQPSDVQMGPGTENILTNDEEYLKKLMQVDPLQ